MIDLPMASAPRERGDAARNRERILDAARRLFSEREPGSVSVDEIAAAARVGKGTVFRRFGDRAGLANALIDEDMRRFQDEFLHGPPPLGPGAPADARVEAFILALLRLQHAKLPFALAAAGVRPTPEAGQALMTHLSALIGELPGDRDSTVVATFLLFAVSPPAIARARAGGASPGTLEASARALLHGIL